MQAVFRENDIRGIIDVDLPCTEMYRLGLAIASYFVINKRPMRTVVVGRDGRIHSPLFSQELIRAFVDSGLQVLDLGLCPTPVMYFALHKLDVDAGIMVTASHNGPEWNGIKINLGTETVWGAEIQKIRELYEKAARVQAAAPGESLAYPMVERYVDWLAEHFSHLYGMKKQIVFDCGNGATGVVMPLLLEKMGWKSASLLYEEVDGMFPNHLADPTVAEHMHDLYGAVQTQGAELGIGFDGDGDRMAAITKTGRLLLGDELLVLFAQYLLQEEPQALVLYDIKCSQLVHQLLGDHSVVIPSGHAIVKAAMRARRALLAGELSCHFFFADRYFGYDDAIYAALRLLEFLEAAEQPLEYIVAQLPQFFATPELRITCPDACKRDVVQQIQAYFVSRKPQELLLIDGVKVHMGFGWGIVRASNTQPVICIRCEAATPEDLQRIKSEFLRALTPYFDAALLMQLR